MELLNYSNSLYYLAMIYVFCFSVAQSVFLFCDKSAVYIDSKAFFDMDLYLHRALQCLVRCPNTGGVTVKWVKEMVLKSYAHKKHRSHLIDYIMISVIN